MRQRVIGLLTSRLSPDQRAMVRTMVRSGGGTRLRLALCILLGIVSAARRRKWETVAVRPGTFVLFVCYGNILRSAFAEHYFRRVSVGSSAAVLCQSAGTHATTGREADAAGRAAAARLGVSLQEHRAHRLAHELAEEADAIVVMDLSNLADLTRVSWRAARKASLLGCSLTPPQLQIDDPYAQGVDVVHATYARIANSIDAALARATAQ